MRYALISLVALEAAIVFAAPKPVGSVATNGTVTISGTALECNEVPSWPIVVGDIIQSGRTETAMMSFPDGSRVLLDKNSVIRVEMRGPSLAVVVVEGSAAFSLSTNSTMRVYANTDLVGGPGSQRSGTASAAGRNRGPKDLEQTLDRWKPPVPKSQESDLSPHKP